MSASESETGTGRERESETGHGRNRLVLRLYLGIAGAGGAVALVGSLAVGAGLVDALRWAYYGAFAGATLVGFPLVFAALAGLLPRPDSRGLVLTVYALVVGVAGFAGLVIGSFGIEGLRPPRFLGLVAFPPTPIGLSAYGALTLATILGVLLGLVEWVSRRYVDERGPRRPSEREAAGRPEESGAGTGTERGDGTD